MGKPILVRMARPSWWGDQGWHILGGFAVCAIVADPLAYAAGWHVALSAALGVLAAEIAATTYEALQNWGDAPEEGAQLDSIFDLSGFGVGSALGVLTLLGV